MKQRLWGVPVWGWAAIALVGVGVFIYLKRRPSSSPAPAPADDGTLAPAIGGTPDQGGAGGAGDFQGIDPNELAAAISDAIQTATDQAAAQVSTGGASSGVGGGSTADGSGGGPAAGWTGSSEPISTFIAGHPALQNAVTTLTSQPYSLPSWANQSVSLPWAPSPATSTAAIDSLRSSVLSSLSPTHIGTLRMA